MRVLLLHETGADLQTRRSTELLAGLQGECCVETLAVGGAAPSSPAALWRLLRSQADLVHAFGGRCLRIASFARKPVLFTPAPVASPRDARWLLSAAAHGHVIAACASAEDHRALVEHGLAMERCHVVRPGVKLTRPSSGRAAARARLGLAPDAFAILLLDETPWGDMRLSAHAVSILHSLSPRYRLLVHGRDRGQQEVMAMARGWPGVSASDVSAEFPEATIEDALALADAAVLAAPGAVPHQPLLACMAAGVPIVGGATRAVSELLEDHHTALLAPLRSKRLAQRLLQLAEDEALRHKLADAARAEAYELFSASRYREAMRGLYAQLLTPQ
jgi:glycosyltransferase involved in cell wall biosynthesis